MKLIKFEDIIRVYLSRVPQAEGILRSLPESLRSDYSIWPHGEANLYDFLSGAFLQPILLPKLSEELIDQEALEACFDFVEGLAKNSDTYVQSALYFEIYEQFLRGRDVLIRAYKFSLPVTRASLSEMLVESYPETLNKIRDEIEH